MEAALFWMLLFGLGGWWVNAVFFPENNPRFDRYDARKYSRRDIINQYPRLDAPVRNTPVKILDRGQGKLQLVHDNSKDITTGQHKDKPKQDNRNRCYCSNKDCTAPGPIPYADMPYVYMRVVRTVGMINDKPIRIKSDKIEYTCLTCMTTEQNMKVCDKLVKNWDL